MGKGSYDEPFFFVRICVRMGSMWTRIYVAFLAVAVIVMAFFSYYSCSWLESIGAPAAAVAGYEYHSGLAWTALWLSVAGLMFIGNAVLWVSGRSWPIWASLAYFAIFIMIRYFWLDPAFFQFRTDNGMSDGSFSVAPLFAVILIVLVAVIAFFDQFIVVKLRAKTYGKPAEPVVDSSEPPAE